MNVLLRISLRNLLRQKRRNILLGTAIAFGAMILIVANSFAHGISDVLFTKVMKYVSGHVSVTFSKNGDMYRPVFHDGDRVLKLARANVAGITQIQETIGYFARAIGNGKSDNIILVGIDLNAYATPEEAAEAEQNFKMIEGLFTDVGDTTVENALIISEEKAKYLNVKKGDIIRLRVRDMNGQDQAVRLTVVGIFKPASVFMSAPAFVEMKNARRILGYGPHDIAELYITMNDPRRNAKPEADKLHELLKPPLAVIAGLAAFAGRDAPVSVFAVRDDSAAQSAMRSRAVLSAGDSTAAWGRNGVAVGAELAARLGVGVGDTIRVTYRGKFLDHDTAFALVARALFVSEDSLAARAILLNDREFYKVFYANWPVSADSVTGAYVPRAGEAAHGLLAPEYILLERSNSTKQMQDRYREIAQKRYRAVTVDVRSMYETASVVLNLEFALNLITLVAVLILFVVILIGVINTLRMTVRERTREIGTIRAIGMQKDDVRNVFLLETFFLALFAALAGCAAAFASMWAVSLIPIEMQDNPMGMLLVNGHIHFAPTILGTVGYMALILGIAVVTAWGPARRAANMVAADALRHYE